MLNLLQLKKGDSEVPVILDMDEVLDQHYFYIQLFT